MIRDFIAIDFETANQEPSSVCSVGVVMVRDGQIVDSFYSLIQPEPNYYNYWCQRVHGISQDDTKDAPVFSKVWQQLEERIVEVYFSDQETDDKRYQIATIPFVAHNARFDEGCLLPFLRYPGSFTSAVRPFSAQSPTSNRCCSLWLQSAKPSSCLGRCRSLCRNSIISLVTSIV